MNVRICTIACWISLLLLPTLSFAGSFAPVAEQGAAAKLERLMLKQQHGQDLLQQQVEKGKARWQTFRQKQQSRPLLERYLRNCLLLVVVAVILGALAGPASNLAAVLGGIFSTLGGLAALGALIFFILWVLDQL